MVLILTSSLVKGQDSAKIDSFYKGNPLLVLYGKTPTLLMPYDKSSKHKKHVAKPTANPLIDLEGTCGVGRRDSMLPPSVITRVQQGLPQPLYILNRVTVSNNPLTNINPSDIESINILKDADAAAIYGSKGENGAILITTKSKVSHSLYKIDTSISATLVNKIRSHTDKVLYIVNGVLQSTDPFPGINPSNIKSVEAIEGADASAIYGNRAANGAILVKIYTPHKIWKYWLWPALVTVDGQMSGHQYRQQRRANYTNYSN